MENNNNVVENEELRVDDDFEPYFFESYDPRDDDDVESVFEDLQRDFEETLRFMSDVVNGFYDEKDDDDGY